MQKRLTPLFLLALGLMLPGIAYAADPVPGMMDQWKAITLAFGEAMVTQGAMLLFGLAGIQFTVNGLNALRKGSDLQELVMHMVWTLVTISFFYTFIVKSPDWFPYIIDQWNAMGGIGTNTGPLDPGAIFAMGLDIVESIRSAVGERAGASLVDMMASLFATFQILFVELFIMLAFLVLAGQLALAMLKGYLWLCLGPVLLGFGGMKYTQDMALNTLKASISVGVTILTCYAIAAMAQASVGIFNDQIATFTLDNWTGLWNCVGVAALIALASWQVPKIANDFLNGTVSGGLGETMATGAVAAAGAAAATGGAASLVVGAGKSAVESLGGIMKAGAAGMNSAADLGKTGLDAVGHAAKEVASHSGGVFGGSMKGMLSDVKSSMQDGMNDSLGGRTAQSIESSRGGSISSAGGDGTAPSASSKSSAGGEGGAGSAGSDATSPSGSTGGGNSVGGDTALGNASQASVSAGGPSGGNGPVTNEELARRFEEAAASMGGQNKPTTADKIRNVASYIPNEPQSVGVNAQLGGGLHD